MENNEIIKALECCVGDNDGKNCFDCPLWEIDGCQERLLLDALGLINRLQADIERLQGWQDLLKAEKHSLIKAEAYKDCIEKVKKELSLIRLGCRELLDNDGVFAIDMARKRVDNLLKEMEREQ